MSLCERVAACMINEAYRVSSDIQNEFKHTHKIGLVAASILFGYVHLYGVNYDYNDDFRFAVIGIQLVASIIAFTPICLGSFVRELILLSKGPLCSGVLVELKHKLTMQWAVKELTHVASLPGRMKKDFVSNTKGLGLCFFLMGLVGLYQAGYMNHHRIKTRHVTIVSALSLLLMSYGIVHIFPNSNLVNLDQSFKNCLVNNETKV